MFSCGWLPLRYFFWIDLGTGCVLTLRPYLNPSCGGFGGGPWGRSVPGSTSERGM